MSQQHKIFGLDSVVVPEFKENELQYNNPFDFKNVDFSFDIIDFGDEQMGIVESIFNEPKTSLLK